MTIDELIQLVTDKEIVTGTQFYDNLITVDQFKSANLSIKDAQKIISDIFIGDDVSTVLTSKNTKKVKKVFKLIPSILKTDITVDKIVDNVLSGKYDDDINGISIFLSIIDNLVQINSNVDLESIYNKILEKPQLAQALKTKM